jgi:hypothetical protein
MSDHLLSTSDNPFNPWTQWDEWLAHDMREQHHTLPYLARIIVSSDELSEADQDLAYDNAVSEILEENINGLYIKVAKPE